MAKPPLCFLKWKTQSKYKSMSRQGKGGREFTYFAE